jgi:hypothetical protein
MTKRTFVLFFCLFQPLALALFSGQAQACYKQEISKHEFFPVWATVSQLTDDPDFCEESSCEASAIVQADDFEWKESIADLLRHRQSTYRFISFDSAPSAFLHFIECYKAIVKPFQSIYLFKKVTVLPDYYNFLHRLCPF